MSNELFAFNVSTTLIPEVEPEQPEAQIWMGDSNAVAAPYCTFYVFAGCSDCQTIGNPPYACRMRTDLAVAATYCCDG